MHERLGHSCGSMTNEFSSGCLTNQKKRAGKRKRKILGWSCIIRCLSSPHSNVAVSGMSICVNTFNKIKQIPNGLMSIVLVKCILTQHLFARARTTHLLHFATRHTTRVHTHTPYMRHFATRFARTPGTRGARASDASSMSY